MELLRQKRASLASNRRGFLDGQFLIAMPGMKDDRFARSVIYICAHSEEGAMGLIINQAQQMLFPDLLVQLGILDEQEAIRLPAAARDFVVRNGGPVDRSRGFVLHSRRLSVESSLAGFGGHLPDRDRRHPARHFQGRGPRKALMALGYSGWGAGQLESEIAENGWLTCPAPPDLLFDADIERKYDRIMRLDRHRSRPSQPRPPVTPEHSGVSRPGELIGRGTRSAAKSSPASVLRLTP